MQLDNKYEQDIVRIQEIFALLTFSFCTAVVIHHCMFAFMYICARAENNLLLQLTKLQTFNAHPRMA